MCSSEHYYYRNSNQWRNCSNLSVVCERYTTGRNKRYLHYFHACRRRYHYLYHDFQLGLRKSYNSQLQYTYCSQLFCQPYPIHYKCNPQRLREPADQSFRKRLPKQRCSDQLGLDIQPCNGKLHSSCSTKHFFYTNSTRILYHYANRSAGKRNCYNHAYYCRTAYCKCYAQCRYGLYRWHRNYTDSKRYSHFLFLDAICRPERYYRYRCNCQSNIQHHLHGNRYS